MTPPKAARWFANACYVIALLILGTAYWPLQRPSAQNMSAAGLPLMQSTVVTTDAGGNFSVAWNTAFATATPFVAALPINAGTQPIECSIVSRSATTVSGKCLQTQVQAVALISLTINIAPINAVSAQVQVFGKDNTQ